MNEPIWMKDLPKKNWADFLKSKKPSFPISSKKATGIFLKGLLNSATSLIEKSHTGQALDRICLGLYFDKTVFLEMLRSEGILRHSSYLEVRNPVPGIAKYLLKYADILKLNGLEKEYFESLIKSVVLHEEMRKLNVIINTGVDQLANRINLHIGDGEMPMSKFKALLAINEYNFLINNTENRELKNFAEYEMHSKEEISSGISLLTERYNKRKGIDKFDMQVIDAVFGQSQAAIDLISAACLFINMKELELEMEIYGFQCVRDGSRIHFKHPDDMFARSLEMSNIQYDLQSTANAVFSSIGYKKVPAIGDIAVQLDKLIPELFEVNPSPFPRYVLKIPLSLFDKTIGGTKMLVWREEYNIIQGITKELMLDRKNWETYIVRPLLSYYDFLRLFRFFILQSHLYAKKFEGLIPEEDRTLLVRSLIPSYKKTDLIGLLENFASSEVVMEFLNVITWNAENDSEPFCDLQYKPIIAFGDHYILPAILTGRSNLTRSVFVSEAKGGNNMKSSQMDKHISIASILKKSFEEKGFVTFSEIPVKFKGSDQSESDIDFMAYSDGLLVIAECKDSVHPIDVFEMRTTYGHFRKAAKQMNYIKATLLDSDFMKVFCKKHELVQEDVKHIQPIIVASNNKFWGSSIDGIPVRNVRELNAFMSQGIWTIGDGTTKPFQYNLWDDPLIFKNADLVKYCSSVSAHQLKLNAFCEETVWYGERISKSTFSLAITDVHKLMQAEYKFSQKTYNQIIKSGKRKLKKAI